MVFGDLLDHHTNDVIGDALAVHMPAPHSFTGEDVCEFQFLGSPLLVQRVLRAIFSMGVVAAEAGEFTKRAFLNGKIDLVQAEAIAEIAAATSDEALRIAGEHLKGRFSRAVEELGEPLRTILADIEATIDFPEEDIAPSKLEELNVSLLAVRDKVYSILASYGYGHVIREGFRVLICGCPNVGKSSLLNLLLGIDRAIVTEVSGTTRDLIEEPATLGGFRFVFCDTAGICQTRDQVEKIGVGLALEKVPWADIVLLLVDATDTTDSWKAVLDLLRPGAKKIWMVTNKIDLNPAAIGSIYCDSTTCEQNFYLSTTTRSGLHELTQALIDEVSHSVPDRGEASQVVTSERQRSCLERALASLDHSRDAIRQKLPLEIISGEVRLALTALEELVGKTYNEDILSRIFSKFCIGK